MTTTNLKLLATSEKDLRVIAAHLQDSIVIPKDTANLKKNRIFLIFFLNFRNHDLNGRLY